MWAKAFGRTVAACGCRSHRTRVPSQQELRGCVSVRLFPELPQVFLEVVGRRQGGIQSQGFFQALLFVAFGVEILRVLKQQPAGAFEHVLVYCLWLRGTTPAAGPKACR